MVLIFTAFITDYDTAFCQKGHAKKQILAQYIGNKHHFCQYLVNLLAYSVETYQLSLSQRKARLTDLPPKILLRGEKSHHSS